MVKNYAYVVGVGLEEKDIANPKKLKRLIVKAHRQILTQLFRLYTLRGHRANLAEDIKQRPRSILLQPQSFSGFPLCFGVK